MTTLDERRAALRRSLGWTLVAALTVAALTACFALLAGSFDEGEWRVIGTSLGFAVFSALGATGASLRLRGGESARTLGGATLVLASASFLALLAALWLDADDFPWRLWGCLSLATLAASHACLVTGARRRTDSDLVRTLASVSIGLGVIDSLAGILGLSGLVDDVDESAAKAIGVLVIALLLTTALPPILRRLGRSSEPPGREPEPERAHGVAAELIATADRIEALAQGNREILRECERLRLLARSGSG